MDSFNYYNNYGYSTDTNGVFDTDTEVWPWIPATSLDLDFLTSLHKVTYTKYQNPIHSTFSNDGSRYITGTRYASIVLLYWKEPTDDSYRLIDSNRTIDLMLNFKAQFPLFYLCLVHAQPTYLPKDSMHQTSR